MYTRQANSLLASDALAFNLGELDVFLPLIIPSVRVLNGNLSCLNDFDAVLMNESIMSDEGFGLVTTPLTDWNHSHNQAPSICWSTPNSPVCIRSPLMYVTINPGKLNTPDK